MSSAPTRAGRHCLIALLVLLGGEGRVAAFGQDRAVLRPCERVYSIVHKVTLDSEGRIAALNVESITAGRDLTRREAARILRALPDSYLAAVRAFLGRRTYPGVRSPFYTFTLYDPAQPERADIGVGTDCRGRPVAN